MNPGMLDRIHTLLDTNAASSVLGLLFVLIFFGRVINLDSGAALNPLGAFMGIVIGSAVTVSIVYVIALHVFHHKRISFNVALLIYLLIQVLLGVLRNV